MYVESGGTHRPGDFRTVAVRTATGDVECPADPARRPLLVPPHGVEVRHARRHGRSAAGLRPAFAPSAAPLPAADDEALAAEAGAEEEAVAAERAAKAGSPGPDNGQNDQGRSES
ncbi:hypothetical protein [Streptomyces genisteinicus]|uniref:Uncharacterized protein n=1 Tax=Streptomyces genisteinicus TaxID=2768068 RepID=A0A7H0HN21_9ACTN|nr:hypothetical protein [Streptomyces genisteinicus]QNP61937.1 hypothetical protein IAG43_02695 [Streptomyces genisteinicus]